MKHTPAIGLLLTIGVIAAGPAFGVEYQKLKSKMDKDRTTWQAQPSPFSAEERKFKITAGAAEEDETRTAPRAAVMEFENGESAADLPAHFDWRNRGGLNYMPQSPHQGSCGSCVSFASMAAVEAQLNIACDAPDRSFDMSRQFFFSCGGGSCKNGWKLSAAMSFLESSGVPDTSCMPYTATDGKDVLCSNACADHKERAINDIKTEQVTTGFIDHEAIKKALLKGPLIANMILYEDLEFYKDGIYRHVDGMKLGTHAIVLVGWDNSDRSWIAMNSWGPTWGQNGFFKVAWDDVSLPGRYTWSINVTRPLQAGICNYPR